MRVAFFGGSFDPIHRGHLAIAAAAADRFALDTILFAPTGRQPLKPDGATASFADRVAMTEFACHADRRFTASLEDAPRPDSRPNYTVDVLTRLHDQHPDATLFNLVGFDSFLNLPLWHQPQRLLELAEWIVVSRPGFSLPDFSAAGASTEDSRIGNLHLTPAQRSRILPLTSVHEDVAATALRLRLGQGDPCLDLIPAPVSAYIQAHGLYR